MIKIDYSELSEKIFNAVGALVDGEAIPLKDDENLFCSQEIDGSYTIGYILECQEGDDVFVDMNLTEDHDDEPFISLSAYDSEEEEGDKLQRPGLREYLSKQPAFHAYKDDPDYDEESYPMYISKVVGKDEALVAYVSLVLVVVGYFEKFRAGSPELC